MHDQPGLNRPAVDALVERANEDVEAGRLPACQLAVALNGTVVEEVTLGEAASDARFTAFSVTKALVAAGVWLLFADGRLSPTDEVAELIPEFAENGKGDVTVEHLLLHTAGFPRAPMRPEEGATREGRLRRFATWRLDWPPGTAYEYHPSSAHWVLAELIERVTGIDFRRFLHDSVIAPLGLSRLRLGVDPADGGDVREIREVGAPGQDLDIGELGRLDVLLRFNDPAVRAVGVPGGGAVSTAGDVALLYQALLHNRPALWDPAVLADGTGVVRNTFPDRITGAAANRTRGLVVAGGDGQAVLREFGKEAGPRSFGASGVGGQIAWADPDTGMSFCYLTDGLDADLVAAFRRSAKISTLAARCVQPLTSDAPSDLS